MTCSESTLSPLAQSGGEPPRSPSGSTSGETAVGSALPSPTVSRCSILQDCTRPSTNDDDHSANHVEKPCHGWPEVAKVIFDNPGLEAFKAYRDLQIKNLLYYQAELDKLRGDLHRIEWEDHYATFKNAEKLCSRVDKLLLCENENNKDFQSQRQIKLVKKLRKLMKEYNGAILQYSQINELPEADESNVRSLRTWLGSVNMGGLHISGPGAHSWGQLRQEAPSSKPIKMQFLLLLRNLLWSKPSQAQKLDLVVPCRRREVDGFTSWIAKEWIPFWHSLRSRMKRPKENTSDVEKVHTSNERNNYGSSSMNNIQQMMSCENSNDEDSPRRTLENTLVTYSMSRMLSFTSYIATIVACLFPTVAIAVLSTMHSTAKLLGFIALFTALFAIGLMTLTSGHSRTEVFTATAAFSAVLVVFVQNQNGNCGGAQQSTA